MRAVTTMTSSSSSETEESEHDERSQEDERDQEEEDHSALLALQRLHQMERLSPWNVASRLDAAGPAVLPHHAPPLSARVPSLVDLALDLLAERARLVDPAAVGDALPPHLRRRAAERLSEGVPATAAWPECAALLACPAVEAVAVPPGPHGDEAIAALLPRAVALRELDLSAAAGPPARPALRLLAASGSLRCLLLRSARVGAVEMLAACPPGLLELDASFTPAVTQGPGAAAVLGAVLRRCPGLEVLRASGAACEDSGALLGAVLERGAALRSVELNGCGDGHSAEGVPPRGSRPLLRSLSLVGTALHAPLLRLVFEACPRLDRLELLGHRRADDDELAAAFCLTRPVRALNAADTPAAEAVVRALTMSSADSLRALDLSWADLPAGSLDALAAAAPRLEVARLACLDDAVGDRCLLALAAHGALTELSVSRCSAVSGEALAAVAAGCPRLRSLNAAWTGDVRNRHVLDVLERCARLEFLSVEGCKAVTDELLEEAPPLPALRRLVLLYVDHVNADAIERFVPRCPHATVVDYYGREFRCPFY